MFPVICKKTPAMWHVGLWEQSASSSHGMNVSASRCVLLISKSNTDLNVCGCEGSPVRVMNSISQLSYRTSKPWRSVRSARPLRLSVRQLRENSRLGEPTGRDAKLLPSSLPHSIRAVPNKEKRLFRQHRPSADNGWGWLSFESSCAIIQTAGRGRPEWGWKTSAATLFGPPSIALAQ
jgi:hypothetical protein